jgi:hypothetical protein
MPYTRGKLKGQLKSSEIRKIVRLHNEMSKIKIPPRLDRDGLIKFIETSGYKIDHENEKLIMTKSMPKDFSLKEAQEKFPVKPRKKKEVKPEKKKKVLMIEDKDDFSQEVKKSRCQKAVAHAESIIRLYEKYNGDFKKFPDYKNKKELDEDVKDLKEGNWGDCSQSDQAKIKKAIKLYDDNSNKKPVKSGKSKKNFKVERFERTKMIQQISSEIGKTFNPFKILEMKASQETPELVKSKCRELRLKNHPDKGGDKEKFDMIQKACDVLLKTQTIIKK